MDKGGGSPQPSGSEAFNQQSTSTQEQSGTSTTTPDAFGQFVRQSVLDNAQGILGQPNFFYPNELVAPFAPDQLAAQELTRRLIFDPGSLRGQTPFQSLNLARLGGPLALGGLNLGQIGERYAKSPAVSSALGNALSAVQSQVDPRNRYVSTNPYLQDAIAAAIQPTLQNYVGNILPQIRTGAIGANQYGGSRQGIAEGLAAAGTQQAVASNAAQIAYDNYLRQQANQLQAAQLTPQLAAAPLGVLGQAQGLLGNVQSLVQNAQGLWGQAYNQAYQHVAALDSVGQAQQRQVQNQIAAELQRYTFNNQISRSDLALYASVLSGLPIGQTTASTALGTQTGQSFGFGSQSQLIPQTNPLFAAAGGALAGPALFGQGGLISSGALGFYGLTNPAAAAIGAGLGLLSIL